MRLLVLVFTTLLTVAISAIAQQTVLPSWQTASAIHFNVAAPRQYIGALFATNTGPLAEGSPPSGVFTRTNLASWGIGENAKAALFNGILVISSGTTAEVSDLGVIFRVPGDTSVTCSVPNFIGQTMYQVTGTSYGGQRSNMSTIVPVVNQEVEWCWYISPSVAPNCGTGSCSHATYAVNLSIQAWFE